MRYIKILLFLSISLVLAACERPSAPSTTQESFADMFEARKSSVVAINYTIRAILDRENRLIYATVISDDGLLVTQGVTADWVPDDWVTDIKVRPLGEESKGYSAEYLGRDSATQLHYFRVEKDLAQRLTSVLDFPKASPRIGDTLWGICSLQISSVYYTPYFGSSTLAMTQPMPWMYHVANGPIACIGGPAFDANGNFVGQAIAGLNVSYSANIEGKSYNAVLRRQAASEVLLSADEFHRFVITDPARLNDRRPWIGLVGMETLPSEVLESHGLEDQSALVVSKIIKDSPAQRSGMQSRDIITALDGKLLKKFPEPKNTVDSFLMTLAQKRPGDIATLTILREGKTFDIDVPLKSMPQRSRESPRQYFAKTGLAIKEFDLDDALQHKLYHLDFTGVVAHYLRPNSPVTDAGLAPGDWIQEIDGTPTNTYQEAIDVLNEIENNPLIAGFVLLVERDNETKLLRVKLN